MKKDQLRQHCRRQLKQLSSAQIATHSTNICQQLLELPSYKNTQHIACFAPTTTEPTIYDFIQKTITHSKQIYLPVIQAKNMMDFIEQTAKTPMSVNRFGIAEPAEGKRIEPALLDWILIPLLGFDRQGYRLGHGGGYYDRFFAANPACNATRIGIAFDCQQVASIPIDAWDIPLNMIITEKQVYQT